MFKRTFLEKFRFLLVFFRIPETVEQSEHQPLPSDIRGEESEEKVFNIINGMMVWKELPTRKKGTFPYRTKRYSDLDRRGVDIVVPTKRGDIYVQVKSSIFGFVSFVNDPRSKDKVCVNGQLDEVTLQKELVRKFRIAYEKLGDRT